ncbi:hypothetical protein [Streptomyces sp. NBC_01296]|uniref:hypothetical protein n=1 Tax=Streptomyces sp. NBC_01296 TaxID=2903816 RepID=UPI002E147EB2|nr:hypothetical protein OG299_07890 [Streptomyces sp. NBC_01296]
MSQTGHERPGQPGHPARPGPEGAAQDDAPPAGDHEPTDDRKPAVTLELLTLLAAGVADLALDQLRQSADRAQDVLRRPDLRDLLTDGVVELRKRGELATRRSGAGAENHLETMARRAAERVAGEGHPRA